MLTEEEKLRLKRIVYIENKRAYKAELIAILKSDEFIRIDDELKEKLIKILGNDNVKLIL